MGLLRRVARPPLSRPSSCTRHGRSALATTRRWGSDGGQVGRRPILATLVLALVVLGLARTAVLSDRSPAVPDAGAATTSAGTAGQSPPASVAAALEQLAALPVKGPAPMTGYSRDQFGPAWADTDKNGCDQRNDVLRRDLTDTTVKPGTHGCVVLTGTLHDPYTGTTIAFTRGQDTSLAVQIDHVVALADAWRTGAQSWTPAKREAYASDAQLVLLAVDGPTNKAKGDANAATWLPPNKTYRCAYATQQVAIKASYGLWVTPPERDALARVLTSC